MPGRDATGTSVTGAVQLDIKARGFAMSDALYGHAERRLRMGLTRCGDRVRRAVMRLSDVDGAGGAADKRCLLRVVLAGLPDVVVDDVESDLYVAIDRATDRAARTVARNIRNRAMPREQGHGSESGSEHTRPAINESQRGKQA